MKYVMMVPDGAADLPDSRLGGKTPLQAAHTPTLDKIAREGIGGTLKTIPDGMGTGSDIATLGLLGYNPSVFYTGRGPLEAAYHGITLGTGEIAYRCNLITEKDGTLFDYSSGHITSTEAQTLIKALNEEFGSENVQFHPGVSYRHLMILHRGGFAETKCYPPHDVLNQLILDVLPSGEGSDFLRELILSSPDVLKDHPINQARITEGKNPANMIWLWGQGGAPQVPKFEDHFHKTGAIISAVDVIKGIGCYAGLDVVHVDGATGYFDTNYEGKAESAMACLKHNDFVFVHVEAPDEAGHEGDPAVKVKTLEDFDARTAGPLLAKLEAMGEPFRVALSPDHATPCQLRTHDPAPVPFALYDPAGTPDAMPAFDEASAAEYGSIHFNTGDELINLLLGD